MPNHQYRRITMLALVIVIGALTIAMFALFGKADNPTTMPIYKYIWDLSNTQDISTLKWPETKSSFDLLWDVPVNGRIIMKFSDNRLFDDYVERVTFCRDGGHLAYVSLSLEPQTLEDAFRRAKQLAATWDVPTQAIDTWYNDATNGSLRSLLAARRHVTPTIDVEIFKTLNSQKPVAITLTLAWLGSTATSNPAFPATRTIP